MESLRLLSLVPHPSYSFLIRFSLFAAQTRVEASVRLAVVAAEQQHFQAYDAYWRGLSRRHSIRDQNT